MLGKIASSSELKYNETGIELEEGLSRFEKAKIGIESLEGTAFVSAEIGFEYARHITNANDFAIGLKYVKTGVRALGVTNLLITGLDAKMNGGWEMHHTIDATIGILCLIPGVGEILGPIWFVGNLISLGVNGRSLSENMAGDYDESLH